MPLPRPLLLACLLLLGALPSRAPAQAAPTSEKPAVSAEAAKAQAEEEQKKEEALAKAMAKRVNEMQRLSGNVSLPEAKATLRLQKGYQFIAKDDAAYILSDIWRNPKEAIAGVHGIIVPQGFNPFLAEAWCVVVSFDKCGYVKDDDAAEIDAKKLLAAFHEHEEEVNAARKKRGYDELWCVDWAENPHYDKDRHIIFWAKRLSSVRAGTDSDTLNYDARCLGRRGLLSLNAVANMKQLPEIKQAMEGIIPQAKFDEGETYADFNSSTDHVAEYTVLGIVAAGAAAKLLGKGAFLVVLLKFGKFLIIPFVAGWKYVVKGSRWLWGKITGQKPAPEATGMVADSPTPPPQDPPSA